jgi:hypothetical protein
VDPSALPPGAVFVAADLDEPAQVIFQPAPRYPAILEEAGVSGAVAAIRHRPSGQGRAGFG